jgi:hypothetical protein
MVSSAAHGRPFFRLLQCRPNAIRDLARDVEHDN